MSSISPLSERDRAEFAPGSLATQLGESEPRRPQRGTDFAKKDWLTDIELAEYLSMSPRTLRRWRLERRGPQWKKFGGAVRYSRAAVDRWVDAQVSYGGDR